nr:uncharacterized protein LOC113829933 [Penaeus vannamei]
MMGAKSCNEHLLSLASTDDASLRCTFGSLSADAFTDAVASSHLHRAAGKGRWQVVEMLLDDGAEVNAKDRSDSSPLHWAAGGGHDAVVELLLSKGAHVNAGNRFGQRPIHYAAYFGHLTTLEVLQERGAAVDVKDDNGDTPLHLAATEGRLLALFSLVKRGAPITKNKRRKTPRDLMKKTSSRDGPGIELFRGVSMGAVLEKWTEVEKEVIKLQRENEKLQDRLEGKTIRIRRLNSKIREMEANVSHAGPSFSSQNVKNTRGSRAAHPERAFRPPDRSMVLPHSVPERMSRAPGAAGRDRPRRGRATGDDFLEATWWGESLRTAGRRSHSSQGAGRDGLLGGEAAGTKSLQGARRRGASLQVAGRKGKSPLAAGRDSHREVTSSDEQSAGWNEFLRAAGRRGESLPAVGRDRTRREATSSDESLQAGSRRGESLQSAGEATSSYESLQSAGETTSSDESLQSASRDRLRGEATSSAVSLQATGWYESLREAGRRSESLQAAGEATSSDESLQAALRWHKPPRASGRYRFRREATGRNEYVRAADRREDPMQAAGGWDELKRAASERQASLRNHQAGGASLRNHQAGGASLRNHQAGGASLCEQRTVVLRGFVDTEQLIVTRIADEMPLRCMYGHLRVNNASQDLSKLMKIKMESIQIDPREDPDRDYFGIDGFLSLYHPNTENHWVYNWVTKEVYGQIVLFVCLHVMSLKVEGCKGGGEGRRQCTTNIWYSCREYVEDFLFSWAEIGKPIRFEEAIRFEVYDLLENRTSICTNFKRRSEPNLVREPQLTKKDKEHKEATPNTTEETTQKTKHTPREKQSFDRKDTDENITEQAPIT